MNNRPCLSFFLMAMASSLVLGCRATAADSARVKALFADPPREYASAPLWVWNDMLTDEQIVSTLRDLAGQKVKQVFVHPRPGLMTPYLSPQWFRLWKVALAEAERLDMNVWIYDENSYPSGFAGGWVPELMPESRGRGLVLRELKEGEGLPKDVVGVYRVEGETVRSILESSAVQPKAGDLVASVQRAGNSPWHGGRCYVDLLYPGVTKKFLEVTMEPYRREIGSAFGRRVPGVFTDEPQLRPAGGMPWTDDLPAVFQKRWGYSLTENLPSLFREVGDWKRVRHNYYQTLHELFVERWGKPYYEYCEKNGLEFTGHYWEHEWPIATLVPDNMAMYAWHQRPAIDVLMNQYNEDVHAQFGNVRAVKELSSVANQLGLKRTLCEAYGAGGWDLRFEDMKRIGDWLYVLGVNTMDEHLSYITLRGSAQRDHPQSFSYHEPWWPDYHVMATYLSRLSAVMSQGEQVNSVLVLQPTTTAWMYNRESSDHPRLKEIGDSFQKLLLSFEAAQIEYDIGCEDIIAGHGSVEGKSFRVGKRGYSIVVLPPATENLNQKTADLIGSYVQNGGALLLLGELPTFVDGRPADRIGRILRENRISSTGPAHAVKALSDMAGAAGLLQAVTSDAEDKGKLFHHRRVLKNGQVLLLVNTSIEYPSRGVASGPGGSVEAWDPVTGRSTAYPSAQASKLSEITARFELPPCGSLLLFFSAEAATANSPPLPVAKAIAPAGEPQVRPLGPNVLTLDYVDVTAGGETRKDQYFYAAQQFIFQKNGMERNPWDSAVQFKDELISRKFPADSGFEAGYRFTIEESVPPGLGIVIERPDLYTVTCNGRPVSASAGQWWLDKAFGRIDLAAVAKVGDNVVTLKASPFTLYHELESAYLLGEFALKPAGKGFAIAPARPMKLGKWNEQGAPFYAEGVAYTEKFQVPSPAGRYHVRLPAWYGSVARVKVNGRDAGRIFHAPWACDVTSGIQAGENVIEVTVVGTLKNTLGPHHGGHGLGSAWPGMFHQGPNPGPPAGDKYATVGYGLFEPFVLEQVQ